MKKFVQSVFSCSQYSSGTRQWVAGSVVRCLLVGVLCSVMSTVQILPLLAANRGPCATFNMPGQSGTSIECVSPGGTCTGMLFTYPFYFTCSNENENPCPNGTEIRSTLITPKTVVDSSWQALLGCLAGNVACATCVLAAGIFSDAVLGGLCASVCGGVGGIDYCCRTTCESQSSTGPIWGYACGTL